MTSTPVGNEPGAPDTSRLVLTMVLCSLVYATWFFTSANDAPPEKPAKAVAAKTAKTAPETPKASPPKVEQVAEPGIVVTANDLPPALFDVSGNPGAVLDTVDSGYRAILSNRGGQFEHFTLDGYLDTDLKDETTGKTPPIDLVAPPVEGVRLLGLQSREGDVQLRVDAPYELLKQDDTHASFTRHTGSGVVVSRNYAFTKDSFMVTQELVLENKSTQAKTVALDMVSAGQARNSDGGGGFMRSYGDQVVGACRVNDDHETVKATDLKDDKLKDYPGSVGYAAMGRRYFLAAAIPGSDVKTDGCAVSKWERPAGKDKDGKPKVESGLITTLRLSPIKLAAGEKKVLHFELYLGPKQLGLLSSQGHGLEENINYGFFKVLAHPILWILVHLHGLVGNFGIAIILLTFFFKLVTFPLNQKSYVSMQAMKIIAPDIKELQKKYGHDRSVLGQKQMDLYKERGINPMAGCFPMLIQMPIWFALYRTLMSSVELYQQPFFAWITDLSAPDPSPLGVPVLPFLVGVLMLGQTLMQPPPADQPQMKYVMYGMPIMFTVFMLGVPSGLCVYMITNSVLTMAQQYLIKRRFKIEP